MPKNRPFFPKWLTLLFAKKFLQKSKGVNLTFCKNWTLKSAKKSFPKWANFYKKAKGLTLLFAKNSDFPKWANFRKTLAKGYKKAKGLTLLFAKNQKSGFSKMGQFLQKSKGVNLTFCQKIGLSKMGQGVLPKNRTFAKQKPKGLTLLFARKGLTFCQKSEKMGPFCQKIKLLGKGVNLTFCQKIGLSKMGHFYKKAKGLTLLFAKNFSKMGHKGLTLLFALSKMGKTAKGLTLLFAKKQKRG